MSRPTSRIFAWMNRVLDMDERYICGCCDDRFPGRTAAIAHVLACHPEYAASFTNEAVDHDPCRQPLPSRAAGPAQPFMPVWG